MGDVAATTGPSAKPIGARSVLLRCSECRNEQAVHLGPGMDGKMEAESFLSLMTGGHYGETPFPYEKTKPGEDTLIGKSLCCGVQIEGEVIEHEAPKAEPS